MGYAIKKYRINQCDGCARNLNIEEGIHYYISSQGNKIYDNACTKDRYVEKETEKKCLCTALGTLNVPGGCPIHSQKENKREEKLNKKLTEWIDSGEIDEGIWIQNEIKDFFNQILTQAIKENMERTEKIVKEHPTFQGIRAEALQALGISKENE